VKAVTLLPGVKGEKFQIAERTDELIIVKDGIIEFNINNEKHVLGEGSVVVISSDDKLLISNPEGINAVCYSISFKPERVKMPYKSPVVVDWEKVEFKPAANGGRRNIMQQPLSHLEELEIHVTTLKEGLQSHSPHVHPDEEIILIRKGFVEETINGKPYRAGPGSLIFLTNDDLHGIGNVGEGECEYYAIRWLTRK
jgi:quercetin dioxygenase-like cupin family protein